MAALRWGSYLAGSPDLGAPIWEPRSGSYGSACGIQLLPHATCAHTAGCCDGLHVVLKAHAWPSIKISVKSPRNQEMSQTSGKSVVVDPARTVGGGTQSLTSTSQSQSSSALAVALQKSIGMDLCIVMDTTGSMSNWLDVCKHHAAEVGPAIKRCMEKANAGRSCEVKLGFVSCKDFNDSGVADKGHLESHPLDANSETVQACISKCRATGGGDICEDVTGALDAAQSPMMGWSRRNKLVIHFVDAPPHGREYHDLGEKADHHLDVGDGLTQTLRKMARQRMSYTVVQCVNDSSKTHLTKFISKAAAVFEEEADAMASQPGKQPKFTAVEVSHSNYQQWFALVIDSCMLSMNPAHKSSVLKAGVDLASSKLASCPTTMRWKSMRASEGPRPSLTRIELESCPSALSPSELAAMRVSKRPGPSMTRIAECGS